MTERDKKIKMVRDMMIFGFILVNETPESFADRHSYDYIQIAFNEWYKKINKR